MKGMTFADILAIPETDMVAGQHDATFEIPAISTDTRTIQRGDVYLALKGERFDGHAFVDAAFQNGASACIVNKEWYTADTSRPVDGICITVPDTLAWYGKIANYYRRKMAIPIIGITGSNGKTTTKELVRSVLSTRYEVHATSGNYNNQIGVPYTLLQLEPQHEVAIIEMGTNQPGDIAELCMIAEPDYGIITNIGRSHLELLQDLEHVAQEKTELYNALPANGIAYRNADDPYLARYSREQIQWVSFGYDSTADIQISDAQLNRFGAPTATFEFKNARYEEQRISMNTPGLHNLYAASIALAVGCDMGCGIQQMRAAIAAFQAPGRRMQFHEHEGYVVIDDAYNANPESTRSALDTLAAMDVAGRRFFLLGDMLELGLESERFHEEMGQYAADHDVDIVYTYGNFSRAASKAAADRVLDSKHFNDQNEMLSVVMKELRSGDVILVKGSRAMNMSSIVSSLLEVKTEEKN